MNHFISLNQLTQEQFDDLISLAQQLKHELKTKGANKPLLAGKTLGMIFQKPSLRTRVSFEVGMLQLGGHALYLSPNEIQLGKRESVADVARVLGRYVNGIMARVFGHNDILELAAHAPVPVINGLSDYNHPCQALADYLTLLEAWGTFENKTLAYVGDSNNVLTSLLHGAIYTGVTVHIASPEGYDPDSKLLAEVQAQGVKVRAFVDPAQAVTGVDAVYTDVWTSMGQEAEQQKRLEAFPPYQVNQALMCHAPNAVVLHCLPAHRGEEITDGVADGAQSRLWDQAENRLHAQKALLVRFLGE